MVRESVRRKVLINFASLLCGWPLVSSLVYPLNPEVSTTRVSPSQCAVETPFQLGGRSLGHLKFGSNGIQWNQVFCSQRKASASLLWITCTPCGELILRDMPNG